MLSTCYCTWCFLSFFLGKNVFSHPLQLRVHPFSQWFMTFSTISSSIFYRTFLAFFTCNSTRFLLNLLLVITISCIYCNFVFHLFSQDKLFLEFYACYMMFDGFLFIFNSSARTSFWNRHASVLVFRNISFLIHLNFPPLAGIIFYSVSKYMDKLKSLKLRFSTWTGSWSFVRCPFRFTSSSHFLQV